MNNEKTTILLYRVATDSGLAPCVQDGLLTLACCKGGRCNRIKTGIRYWVGSKRYDWEKENVYIVGIFKDRLLYYAKVTDVMKMTEYYACTDYQGRSDFIYDVDGDTLARNNKYPCVHSKEDTAQYIRDTHGVYVLMSTEFEYYGTDTQEIPKELIEHIPQGRGAKPITHLSSDIFSKLKPSSDNAMPHEPIWEMCEKCRNNCKIKKRCSK